MKKVIFWSMAVCAIMLTSCGNKTNANADVEEVVDSAAIVAEEANAAADEMVGNLTQLLDGQDVGKFQEALDAIKAKASELVALNPEVAKEYLAKVQNFLKDNADKVKSLVGNNAAAAAAVSALTSVSAEDVVSNFVSSVGNAASDAVEGAVDNAKDAAAKAVEDAKAATVDKAAEAVNEAKEKAASAVDDAAAAAKKKLGL